MKFAPLALAACLTAPLAACHTPVAPIVGGPCRYEFTTVTATVTRVFDDEIEFSEEDGSRFGISPAEFAGPPAPGQRYEFEKRYIVEGACTPYGYQLIGPADD